MKDEDEEILYLLQDTETGYYTKLSLHPDKMPLYNLQGVHPTTACKGRHCAIHNNPSLHELTMEPLVWNDEDAGVKRQCVHGVIHPDVDDLNYRKTVGQYFLYLMHDCDGCCGLDDPK